MAEYKILTGNEACVYGALDAGMDYFAGYPITPATEIAELSSRLLPLHGGVYMQMEDELASIASVIGASAAGAKAMTATSGPGFSLMQENLGYGMMTEIPCVIIDVVRSGPCQGNPTVPAQPDFMQVRWGTHGDHPVIALVPCSVAEAYTETIRAFNLSERFRTPVVVISDATLAHMSERVRIPDKDTLTIVDRRQPDCDPRDFDPYDMTLDDTTPLPAFGSGYRWFASGIVHDNSGFPVTGRGSAIQETLDHLLGKIDHHLDEIESYEEYRTGDAEILLLSAGLLSRSAKEAVDMAREQGVKAGLFRPVTLWPFPKQAFTACCDRARVILSVEMNMGQLKELAEQCANRGQQVGAVLQNDGTLIRAEKILQGIMEVK